MQNLRDVLDSSGSAGLDMATIVLIDEPGQRCDAAEKALLGLDPKYLRIRVISPAQLDYAVTHYKPDLLVLNIACESDELKCVRNVIYEYPYIPLLIMGEASIANATMASTALIMGASDFIEVPATSGDDELFATSMRIHISQLTNTDISGEQSRLDGEKYFHVVSSPPQVQTKVEIVVIGVSAGGPNALAILLETLPATLSVPIIIAQHMPEAFTGQFAESLNGISKLHVQEAYEGARVMPGQIWVAKGDHHLRVERDGETPVLSLNKGPRLHYVRPAVDILFESVEQAYGANVLAVILTGMGRDGLQGCEQLKKSGATVLVQDEKTSAVWGMPKVIQNAGLADQVLPLGEIADEITKLTA